MYPPRCPLCDQVLRIGERGCCRECRGKLPWAAEPVCMKCGTPVRSMETEYCPDCLEQNHFFTRGAAAFIYTGAMRRSVYRMKFGNRRDYIDFYGDAMAFATGSCLDRWRPEVILPVPMHPAKKRKRGYNQAELLARRLGKAAGIPVREDLLRCVRQTPAQKRLNRRERMRNLRGCFAAARDFPPVKRVLLVDDVYTTGCTMDEISRILLENGVENIFFVVLCTGNGKKAVSTAEYL